MPLLCVHGWPETKRIFWRVIEPLAAAGFEVIVPDLRGFGESDVGPDGFHDVASVRDLYALVHDDSATNGSSWSAATSGDRSQELALRYPDWADRMVLFNSPLPYDKERDGRHRDTRPARETTTTSSARAPTPTGWRPTGHAGAAPAVHRHVLHVALLGPPRRDVRPARRHAVVDFHTEPFADAAKLRASFGGYASWFDAEARASRR